MLRQRLQAITEVTDISQHPALLEELAEECPNTVKIVDSPYPLARYTCLVFAFGFAEHPDYVAIASRPFNRFVFASPDFAHWLLDRHVLRELSDKDSRAGDLVIYFNDEGRIKHGGLWIRSDRVCSKWGVGYLYHHQTLEVPESYGNTVKYFQSLPLEAALGQFKLFARMNGIVV